MKKLYFILSLICLSFSLNVHSQDGWFWLNPLPQGNWYRDVEFSVNNTVYVSAEGNTLMKSTDGGNTFVVMSNKESGSALTFINDLTGFSSSTGGILKTTNGGNNWRYISAPVDHVINFSSTPQTILYGLKDNKVYISSDLGESWSLSLTAFPNNILYSVNFPENNIGFAAGYKPAVFNYSRIHKTTNGGISWDTIPTNLRYRINDIFFLNSNTGFIATYISRYLILKSTNGGYNWDTCYNAGSQFSGFKFFDSNTGYIKSNSTIIYTTNQGANWISKFTHYNTFLKDPNSGFGLYENSLSRTSNSGTNWLEISTGFNDVLLDVVFINQFTGFTVGNDKIYKTTNEGLNWSVTHLNLNSGFTIVENIMFLNQSTGYAGIDGGRLAKTTNCGINWEVYKTGNFDHLHGMAFPSVDTGYAVTKHGYTLKTINAGINWSVVGSDSNSYGDIQFINNLTGFSGGFNYIVDKGVIKRTTNGGANWELNYLDSIFWINDICITPQNYWYAVGDGSYNGISQTGLIYRSTDSGTSWQYIQLPQSIASINFSSALTGYASAYNNITYKTTDGGENWF